MNVLRIPIFFALVFISACSSEKTIKSLPLSTGEPGRLVLVSDDMLYKTLEETIDDVFHEPQAWLAQSEAHFKLSKMNTSSFRRSFIVHQTILFLVTRQNLAELQAYLPVMENAMYDSLFRDLKGMPIAVKNRWAKPQHLYFLFAEDLKGMNYKLKNIKQPLLKHLYNQEIKDYKERLFGTKDTTNFIYKAIRDSLGMGVAVTEKYELMKNENGFVWYGERYVGSQNGVLCYTIPYYDTLQFNANILFQIRDSVLKRNVPGPTPGSYLTTSASDLYPRFSETIEVNGQYAKKLRGWWTVLGEFMGGPFVMYAVLDKSGKNIFIYEGFIYAPNKSKSKHLRTLEAFGLTAQ